MASSMITLGIRAAQLVFGIILLGLTAYDKATITRDSGADLALVSHPLVALGLTASNAIFHFAGFIALAVFMSKLLFCRGSVCGSAQASIAFGAIEFLLWTTSAVFTGKEVVQGGFFPKRGAKSQGPLNPSEMKEAPAA
ncbi:hypothetical protein Daesc_003152 [Daldinia eschscholtzii]|uniref:MARVEL domain-containing protein n=1 Tax=Daldinia eschscholtzii TaxID=292717 RepID=A0AAX6MTL3_9PEZI